MSIKRRVLFSGRFLQMMDIGGWEYVERPGVTGVVAILAVTEEGKMLLVEQHRPAVGGRVIEMPAGLAGDVPGGEREALAEAARRELLEETGYTAARMDLLAECPPSPGLCSEVIALFRAVDLKKVAEGGGDESEDIAMHEVPVEEVSAWLDARRKGGLLVDVKVYWGLYFLR